MFRSTPLSAGTRIRAICDFGPITIGQFGIITGVVTPHPWLQRKRYLCTFLGGIRTTALQSEVDRYDHDLSVAFLEDPLWFARGGGHSDPYGDDSVRRFLRYGAGL